MFRLNAKSLTVLARGSAVSGCIYVRHHDIHEPAFPTVKTSDRGMTHHVGPDGIIPDATWSASGHIGGKVVPQHMWNRYGTRVEAVVAVSIFPVQA